VAHKERNHFDFEYISTSVPVETTDMNL